MHLGHMTRKYLKKLLFPYPKLTGFIHEDADRMIGDRQQTTESLVYCEEAATMLMYGKTIYFFLL